MEINMKTLYVTDLDGTLLNSDVKISSRSLEIINSLVENGMHFTFATARSLVSAATVTQGLNLKLPVAVYNGTFIMDKETGEIIHSNFFSDEENSVIQAVIKRYSLNPFVYSFVNGEEKVSYNKNYSNRGKREYIESRKNDRRMTPLDNDKTLFDGKVFYYSIIGREKDLSVFFSEIKSLGDYRVTFQQDIYSEYFWCEIMPKNASKAKAVEKLKKLYSFDKIVAFGDALNDMPMFQIADRCYAVENAVNELKDISTKEILSNNNDGVALFLQQEFNK
ncbi:MAG: HAD family hydrolase [Oscillospiraceae bacterium]|nr:HAD family hydrolase [Oscillospiraceae bacterium]